MSDPAGMMEMSTQQRPEPDNNRPQSRWVRALGEGFVPHFEPHVEQHSEVHPANARPSDRVFRIDGHESKECPNGL